MSPFYVKIRGRIHGPFDEAKLRTMVQKGQLSRIHVVSENQQDWIKAGELTELFLKDETTPETDPQNPGSNHQENSAATATVDSPFEKDSIQEEPKAANTSQPPGGNRTWYYGDGDNPVGPFNETQIEQMINSGQLNQETYLWKEGIADWLTLPNIPEFRAAFQATSQPYPQPVAGAYAQPVAGAHPQPVAGAHPQPVAGAHPQPVAGAYAVPIHVYTGMGTQSHSMTENPNGVAPLVVNSFSASRVWVLMVGILLTIGTVFFAIAAISQFAQGAQNNSDYLIGMGFGSLINAVIIGIGCAFIYPVASNIQKLKASPTQSELLQVSESYRKLWLYIGVVTVITIALGIVLAVVYVAMEL